MSRRKIQKPMLLAKIQTDNKQGESRFLTRGITYNHLVRRALVIKLSVRILPFLDAPFAALCNSARDCVL